MKFAQSPRNTGQLYLINYNKYCGRETKGRKMKFRRVQSYKLRRLFPMLGIAGIATLGTVGCEKEDDFKTQIRTETKHDTVYVKKTDTINSVKSDTIYLPGDTIYTPRDTIYIPGDTIYTPNDTIYIPGDTVYTKPDTIYTPSKPDTIYIPSKPDTVYIPVIPHHNTTYVWGIDYWDQVWPADKVAASADSTSVDIVYLKNDGVSWGGCPTSVVLQSITPVIESVSSKNRHKIRGAGTLNDVYVRDEQCRQDSITLANYGFKFGNVYHPQKSKSR